MFRAVVEYLQKTRRLDILLALKNIPSPTWKRVQRWLITQKISANDHTYRQACEELTTLGLARATQVEPRKFQYRLTSVGYQIATIIESALEQIKRTVEPSSDHPKQLSLVGE